MKRNEAIDMVKRDYGLRNIHVAEPHQDEGKVYMLIREDTGKSYYDEAGPEFLTAYDK